MTTNPKTALRSPAPHAVLPWRMPPCTTEERLERIEVMGRRISGYVQFMCKLGNSNSASAEAKEKAVDAFYEQMVVLERQLRCIHDDFQCE